MDSLPVKLSIAGSMYKIDLSPPSLARLTEVTKSMANAPPNASVRFTYIDEEGDEITLFDDNSFVDMRKSTSNTGKSLRISE